MLVQFHFHAFALHYLPAPTNFVAPHEISLTPMTMAIRAFRKNATRIERG